MVKVEVIKALKGGNLYLLLNNKKVLILPPSALIDYKVKVGQELAESTLQSLYQLESKQKLYSKAISLISYKPRTKKDLKSKLKSLNAEAKDLDYTLNKLEDQGYINEEGLAQSLAQSLKNKLKGPVYIRYKLKQKGINNTKIDSILRDLFPDTNTEIDQIKKLISKKTRNSSALDQKSKKRLYDLLIRSGFSHDSSLKCLKVD